jgi:hypothetical protein
MTESSDRKKRALRLDLDAEDVSQGLGRLVVALLDVVRQLLERQALRRVDANALTPEQIERVGQALLSLQGGIVDLRDMFGVPEGEVALPLKVVDLPGTEQTGASP